jgi:signal transduction histidine kinase
VLNVPQLSKQFLALPLTILFVGIIIIGSIYTSFQTQKELTLYLEEDIQVQESQLAQAVANSLRSEIIGIQEKLTLISKIPQVQDPTSADQCNEQLQETFEIMERKVGNLGRVNTNRIFACSLNKALIGLPAEQLGQYITDIFTDPDHKTVMSRVILPPGSSSFIIALHIPVLNQAGQFDGTLGGAIYMDQLESKYFRDIRLSPNGHIVLLDDNGDILYHPYRDLIGKNYNSDEFKKYASPTAYQDIIEMGKSVQPHTARYIFDGEEKVGAAAPVEILPNRTLIVLVTTPVKDIKAKLIQLHISSLFQNFITFNTVLIGLSAIIFSYLIFRNIRSLVELTKQLKRLDRLKDDFVSVASHELRTPMTAVKGIVSMIFEGDYGKVPKHLSQPLTDIASATDRLIALVNDLLNLGRIEAGRIKFSVTTTTIREVINPTVALLKPLFETKGLTIKVSNLPTDQIQTDVEKLQQVLSNLIGNALKFTDRGGVTLTGKIQEDKVIIFITDTGIGISPKDQDVLFSKFQQISSQQQGRPTGTGLGLYISRELVRKLGGDIWIEKSELGAGTTFGFSLPLANSPTAHIIKTNLAEEALKHPDQK